MRPYVILCAAAALLFVLSGCATSQTGVVLRYDDWADTLRIGDEVYHLTPDAELFGRDGLRISLHEVPTLSDPNVGVRYASRAHVEFCAHQIDGKQYIDRLWVRSP